MHNMYIYIYIWYPPRSTSEHFYILSHIKYVYLCAYVYKDAVKFQDVLWVVAVHTIKTVGRNTIFDDSLGDTLWETPLTKSKKHRKTKKTKNKQDSRSLAKEKNTKIKKPRENKKTRLFRECLVWGCSCLFFLVLPFFCFYLEKWKKQKIQGFFLGGCLDKMMVEELWETKKT